MAIVEHKPESGDPKPLILGLSLLVIVVLAVGGVIYWMMRAPKAKTIKLSDEQVKQQTNTGPVAAAIPPGPPFPTPAPIAQAQDPGATMITLDLKNVTVAEAIAAMAKQGNATIAPYRPGQMGGGFMGAMQTKRISLSVNNQPFWIAMRELCKQADVFPYAGWENRDKPSVITLQNGSQGDRENPMITVGSSVILLKSVTTRFDADLVVTKPPTRSLNVALTLFVEPKLNAYRISPVAVIETAADENGTSLVKPPDQYADRSGSRPGSNWMADIDCRLNNPANAGQKIARLRGYISVATAGTKNETVTIKDPLNAKNQDQKIDGTLIRVVQVRKQGGSSYEARFQADATAPTFKDYDMFSKVVKMYDAAGKEFGHSGGSWGGGNKNVMDFGLYFNANGAGEPTEMRITLPTGVRELRVPFEFTDLPLPH